MAAAPDNSCDVLVMARSAAANNPMTRRNLDSHGTDAWGVGACQPVSVLLCTSYVSLETQPHDVPATLRLPQEPRVALSAVEEAGNLRLQSCHARNREWAARLATTVDLAHCRPGLATQGP